MEMSYNSKSSGVVFKLALVVILIVGVSLFIFFLGKSTNKETEVVISDTTFEVKGMFGETFSFDKVTSIEMKETMPTIGKKINGSGLGEVSKGSFELEGLGECKLFTLSRSGPFLYILVDEKYIIINYKDKEKTEKLYNDLLVAWKK